jgi:hypothetical protein
MCTVCPAGGARVVGPCHAAHAGKFQQDDGTSAGSNTTFTVPGVTARIVTPMVAAKLR